MKYDVKYACGHTGTVNLFGKRKDREYRLEYISKGVCPDCWRAKKLDEAAEVEERENLPELSGSEKQIAWARSIRKKLLDELEQLLGQGRVKTERAEVLIEYGFSRKTTAKWWIENARGGLNQFFQELNAEVPENETLESLNADEAAEAEVEEETTVYPENAISNAPVAIESEDGSVVLKFERNDRFIEVAKTNGFRWNGKRWAKKVGQLDGDIQERVAEIGNILLNAGFGVTIADKETREKAVEGNFSPEVQRWVLKADDETVRFFWKYRDKDMFATIKSLPGSKYAGGSIRVPAVHFDAIMDTARALDFTVSEKANAVMDAAREKVEGAPVVSPAKPKATNEQPGFKRADNEVIDDLRDED